MLYNDEVYTAINQAQARANGDGPDQGTGWAKDSNDGSGSGGGGVNTGQLNTAINAHNISDISHDDLRVLITALQTAVAAINTSGASGIRVYDSNETYVLGEVVTRGVTPFIMWSEALGNVNNPGARKETGWLNVARVAQFAGELTGTDTHDAKRGEIHYVEQNIAGPSGLKHIRSGLYIA